MQLIERVQNKFITPTQIFNIHIHNIISGRLIALMFANLVNWTFAICGILIFVYDWETDFATYLLGIFMTNTFMYLIFYMAMKVNI